MTRTPKRPRDPNQLAKMVVDVVTKEVEDGATPKIPSAPSNTKITSKRSVVAKKD